MTSRDLLVEVAARRRNHAHIHRVLEAVDWNKKEAARLLDISRGTLYRKITEYHMEPSSRASDRDRDA